MVKVKICGVCRPADAAAAAAAGADYVGVIVGAPGLRLRAPDAAAAIFAAAVGVARVGVFADVEVAEVVERARRLSLDVLQLHGSESAAAVAALRGEGPWSIWKAVRPRDAGELLAALETYGDGVDGLLVDGWSVAATGGTGTRAPWELLGRLRSRVPAGVRFIAAGGLRPENVADAIAALVPDVVDVSSGVEQRIGEKSTERVRAFIAAARGARTNNQDRTDA
jgi:phosphoribosylanthranilate isomerase